MKGKSSLLWIDWRLAGASVGRQSMARAAFLCVLAAVLLVLLLSDGIGRVLSSRYAITAVLRDSVSAEDAQGLARKAAGLPPVASAAYRDSAEAWKEFLKAYPGLESLPDLGGNPLPGYIQIRIRKDRFTASDLDLVVSALRPLPAVERVLTGEDALAGLLRADRYAALLFWAAFGAFAAAFSMVCVLQEQVRGLSSGGGFRYLLEQGVPGRQLALSRAAGAAIWNLLLAACATGAAGGALSLFLGRFAVLRTVIGPPEDLLTQPVATGAIVFIVCVAFVAAVASLLGWRAVGASGK